MAEKELLLKIKALVEGGQDVAILKKELDKFVDSLAKKPGETVLDSLESEAKNVSEAFKKLGLSADNIATGIDKTEADVIRSFESIASSALVTSKEIEAAFIKARASIKSPEGLNEFKQSIESLDKTSTNFKGSLVDLDDKLQKSSKSAKETASSTDLITRSFQALIALGAGKYFIDTTDAITKLVTGLNQINGSTEKTRDDFVLLKSLADKLGLSITTVGDQYLALAAAAKGTNLEGNQTKVIFESVATAMAALGRSGPEVENALRAVQQIMSKGKLSAEELRGQLGEALPGAFQIAADAMGVTQAALDKMLELGVVFSDEFLPRFAKQLNKTIGDVKPIETWEAAFNRALNNVADTMFRVSETGVKGFGTKIIEGLGKTVLALQAFPIVMDNVASASGEMAATFETGGKASDAAKERFLNMVNQLHDLNMQLIGSQTEAEKLAERNKKLTEAVEAAITPLKRLQDAAATGNIDRLDQSLKIAIDSIRKTGDVAGAAQEALKKFLEEPAKIGDTTKVLELANIIKLIGQQADDSATKLQTGLGKALEKLTSEQLLALQSQAKSTLDAFIQGGDETQESIKGLGEIIEGVAIASLNKLGIDGVDAIRKVDAGFQETIELLDVLSRNALVSGDVLAKAFEKGIGAATTIEEIDKIRSLLAEIGESGRLSAEQISLAMVDVYKKTAELAASFDPLIQALNQVGVDGTEAFTGMDAEMRTTIDTLNVLAESARITGDILFKAINESIATANTIAELEALKAKVEEFGVAGKLSADQVTLAITELNVKLQTTKDAVDPVTQAFQNLGVQSAKELNAIANQAVASFEIIKKSGANVGEVNAAFEAMAQKVAKAAETAGAFGKEMILSNLKIMASTEEQIAVVQKLENSLSNVGDTAVKTADKQVTATDKATKAIQTQKTAVDDVGKSMVGVELATVKVGNQLVAAFDTKGIAQYNSAIASVNDWIEQARATTERLNSGATWNNAISSAQYLAENMADVQGYAEDTVKTVRDDLVSAINKAKQAMEEFAADEQQAAIKARQAIEDMRVSNDQSAREQLEHKRNLEALNEKLRKAEITDNLAATQAIRDQIQLENERHQLAMENAKAESGTGFGARVKADALQAQMALEGLRPIIDETHEAMVGFWPDIELMPAFGRFQGAIDGVAQKIGVIQTNAQNARMAISSMTEAGT